MFTRNYFIVSFTLLVIIAGIVWTFFSNAPEVDIPAINQCRSQASKLLFVDNPENPNNSRLGYYIYIAECVPVQYKDVPEMKRNEKMIEQIKTELSIE